MTLVEMNKLLGTKGFVSLQDGNRASGEFEVLIVDVRQMPFSPSLSHGYTQVKLHCLPNGGFAWMPLSSVRLNACTCKWQD